MDKFSGVGEPAAGTFDFLREQLLYAAYSEVRRCDFGATLSHFADLASLDNRRRESLFVEAVK